MCQQRHLLLAFFICIVFTYFIPGSLKLAVADEKETFSGTWVANGSKEILALGENREAALFKLSGHVNLLNKVGEESDYWSECIGLADSEKGSNARCVWKSLNGQEIYLHLQSEQLSEGSRVTGVIVGGNRAAEGISGNLNFIWSSMSAHSSNGKINIGGYAKELSGSYQLP